MSSYTQRKNKITLSDYNYRQDIENRLFLAELSILEVDVLRELINGSLKTQVSTLVDNLNISEKKIRSILDKLERSRLFKIVGEDITVDKEMRKYYETQIIKFDDDFNPDLDYLQGLLSKVPIHALPVWYAIPRSSDHIFHSIVEKFMHTPRTYERYLQDLSFDQPILHAIIKEVYSSSAYKVSAKELIEKFNLTRELFEEYMLFLEFNLVCCISYQKAEDLWEEVATPFHEWREYQLFISESNPSIIKDIQSIKRNYPKEFGFILELNAFLKGLLQKTISLKDAPSHLVNTALALKVAKVDKHKVIASSDTSDWLNKSLIEQAIFLYRQTLNLILKDHENSIFGEKDFREVEKSLKRLVHGNWVYFDDFIKGCIGAIGSTLPVQLQNKGRRWKYSLPKYNQQELQFIEKTCCYYLLQAGVVDVGTHNDKLCLCLTTFGQHSLA